jgi:hypothetical protein
MKFYPKTMTKENVHHTLTPHLQLRNLHSLHNALIGPRALSRPAILLLLPILIQPNRTSTRAVSTATYNLHIVVLAVVICELDIVLAAKTWVFLVA